MNNWESTNLGKVLELIVSNVDKKIDKHERVVNLCNYLDVYRNRYLNSTCDFSLGSVTEAEYEKFKLKIGDVIITKDSETPDDIAIPSVIDDQIAELICGYHLAILRTDSQKVLDGHFLMNLLQHHPVKSQFSSVAGGATRFGLTRDAILNVKIDYPIQLTEQKRIANIIRSVDISISENKKLLNKVTDLKKALMQELFTKGIGHKEFKDSPLGKIPKEWSTGHILEYLVEKSPIRTGPFGSSLKKEMYVPHGYKVYGQEQVIANNFAIGNYFIDEQKFKELQSYEVNPFDILISLVGTFGKISLVPENILSGIINPRLIRIRPNQNKCYPFFLKHLLQTDIFSVQASQRTHGGTMGILNMEIIRSIKLPLVPFPEQKQIASTLESIENRIITHSLKIEAMKNLKQALMQDLLSGKVRVNTDALELAGATK
jgi:type I restriction enzyme S subunit